MKKIILYIAFVISCVMGMSQQCYWVFLTDKQGSTFDPYTYFDAKAIDRYRQCGADLYDITNYPVASFYADQVNSLAIEEVGQSRWLNAVAVMATPDQIAQIEQLPFVGHTALIGGGMMLAQVHQSEKSTNQQINKSTNQPALADQLLRMQGDKFVAQGIDGKGIRIAVLDNGFPRVNTHKAFKHLRDNNRILDTWNFPTKKSDVYGWGTHGLMTLSCITGVFDTVQLGLATGAEFLLYRTEINTEPFKEEVWWMQGMERADQHGANLISSSLGYGKDRYFTKDMDGTSYVAKAANLAARKGILVCNSAGNEGDDNSWKTIITPSDADSVLCVGGITHSLDLYRHISFSSYGPSADGRLKPNVVAFGHALAAANNDQKIHEVDGTSFSCPLVAGFAACAWQTMPGKTAMEMLKLIQQSADLYPYYDYALGYGVPQASFFVEEGKSVEPTFHLVDRKDSIEVQFVKYQPRMTVFFNKQNPDGTLVKYSSAEFSKVSPNYRLFFHKGALDSCTLNVSYAGYIESFKLTPEDQYRMRWERREFAPWCINEDSTRSRYQYQRTADDLKPSLWGKNARWNAEFAVAFGNIIRTQSEERRIKAYSPASHIGGRILFAAAKAYRLGLGVEYAAARYNFQPTPLNSIDNLFNVAADGLKQKHYLYQECAIELFQRIRFTPGGITGSGVHWDLGAYVGFGGYTYQLKYNQLNHASGATLTYYNPRHVDAYHTNFGIVTRVAYDWIGLYARYRLTGFATKYDLDPNNPTAFQMRLPRLEVGIELSL